MKSSDKRQLRMVAGDLSGLYGMTDVILNNGRSKGVRAIEMKTDKGLNCMVLADRCLDIPYLSYKGTNLGLVTKVGVSSPNLYTEDDVRGFMKQFNAGLITTCGITYAGQAGEYNGRAYGLHGGIANTPAENVNFFETVENDEIVLNICGDVREACVFEECMYLRRSIKLYTEQNIISIEDTVENCGFTKQPAMNLYHINFGYPLLDKGAKCYFTAPNIEPYNEISKEKMGTYALMESPYPEGPELVYTHTGDTGNGYGMLYNEALNLAVVVHYDADTMPYFNEWKSLVGGDYAIGLEPCISGFRGRAYAEKNGLIKYVEPGERMVFKFSIEVLDDIKKIHEYAKKCKEWNG